MLCPRLKIYALLVSTLAFVFKIIGPIIFSAVKEVNFLRSRNFSSFKELFHSQGTFPQKDFYLIKTIFHKQESFLQTKIFL